jgi:hypothetical protein
MEGMDVDGVGAGSIPTARSLSSTCCSGDAVWRHALATHIDLNPDVSAAVLADRLMKLDWPYDEPVRIVE